jgi:DNA invertase Pin-like site-specific DNA recombinase
MKIGYARVSTLEQNLDLQLQALKKAGCRRIFQEKISASIGNRPEFQRMLDQIRAGDTIVVWKLDRLALSTRYLLETMEMIQETDAKFQSLSEPWADTTTHAGKMIMTIFSGIAEFERGLIRERTSAGREAAKKRGVRFGRPPKLTADQRLLARRLVSEGKPEKLHRFLMSIQRRFIDWLLPEAIFVAQMRPAGSILPIAARFTARRPRFIKAIDTSHRSRIQTLGRQGGHDGPDRTGSLNNRWQSWIRSGLCSGVARRRRTRRHYGSHSARTARNCGTAQLHSKSGACYPSGYDRPTGRTSGCDHGRTAPWTHHGAD